MVKRTRNKHKGKDNDGYKSMNRKQRWVRESILLKQKIKSLEKANKIAKPLLILIKKK